MSTPLRRAEGRPLKACACGRSYTRKQWDALPYVGENVDELERLELRNCRCGSTIALGRSRVRIDYSIEPTSRGWEAWRRTSDGVETALVGKGGRRVFASMRELKSVVDRLRQRDRTAAEHLGVELVDDELTVRVATKPPPASLSAGPRGSRSGRL